MANNQFRCCWLLLYSIKHSMHLSLCVLRVSKLIVRLHWLMLCIWPMDNICCLWFLLLLLLLPLRWWWTRRCEAVVLVRRGNAIDSQRKANPPKNCYLGCSGNVYLKIEDENKIKMYESKWATDKDQFQLVNK